MGLSAVFLQQLAYAGSLAPSGDNLQPWSFEVNGDTLLLRHDAQRDRSLFNVQHLASFIALGAVVENIVIAATKENYQAKVAYFPDAQGDSLIARIDFAAGASIDPLVDFLEKRCTNRKPYERRPFDVATRKLLEIDLIPYPGVQVAWNFDDANLKKVGQIVAKADRLIFENSRIHSHLFSTIRWNRAEVERTRDGLPIETLELGTIGSLAFRALKHWTVVRLLNKIGFSLMAAKQSALLTRCSSATALITVADSSPQSFFSAGRVFQRIWLQATKENLSLQPMTAVVFLQMKSILNQYQGLTPEQIPVVAALGREIKKVYSILPARIPAMQFRIGYAPQPLARTLRRNILLS